jgi:PAS domain S-box-containing protein
MRRSPFFKRVASWVRRVEVPLQLDFPWPLRYGLALASCFVAALLTTLFRDHLSGSPFLIFWPAMVLSTWYGGIGPGVLSVLLSQFFTDFLLYLPEGGFSLTVGFAMRAVTLMASIAMVILLRYSRLRVERALRFSQQETLDILESIVDPFYGLDQDWHFTYVNEAAARLWGRPREKLVGKRIWDEFPEGAHGPASRVIRECAQDRMPRQLETYSEMLKRWVEVRVYPTSMGISVYFHDITDRKQSEQRTALLQEITARFSEAVTSQAVAEVIIEKGASALGGSGGLVAILANDRQTVQLVHERSIAAMHLESLMQSPLSMPWTISDTIRSGQPVFLETIEACVARYPGMESILRHNGTQAIATVPLTVSNTVIGAFSVLFAEPRHLSAAEKELLLALAHQCAQALDRARLYEVEVRARQSAEEANRLKMQFLGMISHELRTPLASIKGFTTTLLASDISFTSDEQHQFLNIVNDETDRLTELVEQLLDLSRLQAGTLQIRPRPQSFASILDAAMPQLRVLTAQHPLLIEAREDLPIVMADVRRIGQVLTNLVGNSAKFSPAEASIILRATVQDGRVQVDVVDEGAGIPEGARDLVFEAFRQIEDRRVSRDGAGLGLAICKGVVEAHGQRIWIHANYPRGTIVSFTLAIA